MDLEKSWSELGKGDRLPEDLLHQSILNKKPALNPLSKLKRNLAINMAWAVPILTCYLLLYMFVNEPLVRLSMFILFVFTLWALASTYRLYRQLDARVCAHCNVLEEMQRYHALIHQWTINQQKVAAFFYPIGAAGGFILGGSIGAGKPVAEIMTKTPIQIALVLSILILTPLAWLLARWMTRVAFGRYLDELQERIHQLKSA